MKTELEVDGAAYELVPTISQDSIGISLIVAIRRGEDRVAQLHFRCAVDEPMYQDVDALGAEEMLELILRRGEMANRVRSALHWQSELERVQPGVISGLIVPLFPENHSRARH